MTQLLIDGDEYLFKACVLAETDIRWDDQNHVLQANENEAWKTFVKSIERAANKFGVDPVKDVILCFSGTYTTPNFRLAIDPNYKASRADKRKPLCYADLRETIDELYTTQTFPGLEADDVMGIMATQPKANRIIVSQDKDMKTIPAQVWDGKDGTLTRWTEAEADYWHMFQTLTGDAVDGYKGCPGMGAVGAQKLLYQDDDKATGSPSYSGPWGRVVAAYEKKKLTAEDALRNARLARILRWDDWDRRRRSRYYGAAIASVSIGHEVYTHCTLVPL
jgi:DNA polymerase-1